MKNYKIYQVDAFTKTPFAGNPAGVVSNADGLTEEQMQKIAREMHCSETAFIFASQSPDYNMEVRFFTPTTEVPLCGHATIASQYVYALENNLPSTHLKQKTKAGILPIEIIKVENDYEIVMTQARFEFGPILSGEKLEPFCKALGIQRSDLDTKCPVQKVSTGHPKLILAVKSREILNALKPDQMQLLSLAKEFGYRGIFVFTFDSDSKDILTHARMFAPELGISEDPVTGMANGPLGAYIVKHRLAVFSSNEFSFVSQQGEAIDRAGLVKVMVSCTNGEPERVRISGNAVVVIAGSLSVSD